MTEYICKEDFIKILKEKSPIPFVETNVIIGAVSVFPAADVQPVVRCKDCARRPYFDPPESEDNCDLVFPDYRFNPCPCRVEDIWYSWMPDDDWFCAYGKRKDGEA